MANLLETNNIAEITRTNTPQDMEDYAMMIQNMREEKIGGLNLIQLAVTLAHKEKVKNGDYKTINLETFEPISPKELHHLIGVHPIGDDKFVLSMAFPISQRWYNETDYTAEFWKIAGKLKWNQAKINRLRTIFEGHFPERNNDPSKWIAPPIAGNWDDRLGKGATSTLWLDLNSKMIHLEIGDPKFNQYTTDNMMSHLNISEEDARERFAPATIFYNWDIMMELAGFIGMPFDRDYLPGFLDIAFLIEFHDRPHVERLDLTFIFDDEDGNPTETEIAYVFQANFPYKIKPKNYKDARTRFDIAVSQLKVDENKKQEKTQKIELMRKKKKDQKQKKENVVLLQSQK
ncbi:MAG: hypothetical protein CXT73_04430 [Methanobacteriota archaeon]|nr:MAG: hypothetical protein CXT73_04430 [Euryarchaeota archaeon]